MTGRLMAMSLAFLVLACGASPDRDGLDDRVLAQRASHLEQRAAQPDSGLKRGVPLARWVLPASLSEVSGLALTSDDRLFAHGDELAQVSEIDYRRGVLVKQFTVGKHVLHADFEGIAVVGARFFLLASDGKLYEFREGDNGSRVDYVVHDTKLGKECEFEGVTFDPESNSLLLACKNVDVKALKRNLVLYRWSMSDSGTIDVPAVAVPLREAIGTNNWKDLHPSDITRDPVSGNYLIITAQEKALIGLTPQGDVALSRPLPEELEHTEGIAVTSDSLVILSEEAGKRPAMISVYRWR